MKSLLTVLIPTYNRPIQASEALTSVYNALSLIPNLNRKLISLSVRNNSTHHVFEYQPLIDHYRSLFADLGLGSFDYTYSGLNIGSYQNIAGGLLSAAHNSDYIWILPDDDIMSPNAIQTLIPILQNYNPCFVSGAGLKKTTLSYNKSYSQPDKLQANRVYRVLETTEEKIDFFLHDNVVEAQEYVYQSKQVLRYFTTMPYADFSNEMFPGTIALYSLLSEYPYVSLEHSIGFFRDDDPNSSWRHLWFKYSLIDWPSISERFYSMGLLTKSQYFISSRIYSGVFSAIRHRPDVLSGINRRFKLNPYLLFRYHGVTYLRILFLSPFLMARALISYSQGLLH